MMTFCCSCCCFRREQFSEGVGSSVKQLEEEFGGGGTVEQLRGGLRRKQLEVGRGRVGN